MKQTDENYQEYKKALEEWIGSRYNDQKIVDRYVGHHLDSTAAVVKLTDGRLCNIYQNRVNKQIYIGYSCCGQGRSYEEALSIANEAEDNNELRRMFIENNTQWLRQMISALADTYGAHFCSTVGRFVRVGLCFGASQPQISEADRQILQKAFMEEEKRLTERLQNYFKRYNRHIGVKLYCTDY